MSSNDSTPLPPGGEEALDILEPPIRDNGEIARDRAHSLLVDASFDAFEAREVIDQLLQRGYLYAVDDCLRITD